MSLTTDSDTVIIKLQEDYSNQNVLLKIVFSHFPLRAGWITAVAAMAITSSKQSRRL